MTDNLSAKFGDIEQLMVSHHDELMAKLDDLITVLTPPEIPPGVTLADVNGNLIGILTAVLGIRTDMAANHTDIFDSLGMLVQQGELLLGNNSLNTQRLLAALAALDPCKPCDAPPLTLPPADVTPAIIDAEHCKRMQALIHALKELTVKFDVLSSFGVNFSLTVIQDAIQEVITELGNPGTLLLPSFAEISRLIAASVAYVASAFFSEKSLPRALNDIEADLLSALYQAGSAEAGRSAFETIVRASGKDIYTQNLLLALGYISLFNFYYDRSQEANLGGYDGNICGEIQCDLLVDSDYDVTPGTFESDHFWGYQSVELRTTATAASGQIHLWVEFELRYSGASPSYTIEALDGAEFWITIDSPNHATGHVTMIGCPAKSGGGN